MFQIMRSKNKKKQGTKTVRSSDVPVTVGHLNSFRQEIISTVIEHTNQQFLERDVSIGQRFESIDRRFDEIDQRFEAIDRRFELMDKKFEAIDKRLEQIDKKFEAIDKRFEQVDKRFELMEKRMQQGFDQMNDKMDRRFARLEVLIYEQNSRNLFVLDGYNDLSARIAKLENKT